MKWWTAYFIPTDPSHIPPYRSGFEINEPIYDPNPFRNPIVPHGLVARWAMVEALENFIDDLTLTICLRGAFEKCFKISEEFIKDHS